MFWALLASTNPEDGLVDVVRLSLDTGSGVQYDRMTDVSEKPGFQLGSAVCTSGNLPDENFLFMGDQVG